MELRRPWYLDLCSLESLREGRMATLVIADLAMAIVLPSLVDHRLRMAITLLEIIAERNL